MTWTTPVAPLGNAALAALAAALPVVLYGLVPIGAIVVAAVFLQDVATATGSFGRLRDALSRATSDRALQALLIAFGFGALLEGSARFGAPVAISGGILVGLGFLALPSAAFGGLGARETARILGSTIAVACAACGLSGRAGELLRRAMPLSLGHCGLVALLTLATTHLAPGLVPSPGPAAVPQAADPAAGLGLLGLSLVLAALVARLGRRCERTVPVVSSPGR